jgi:1-acylglycerone phosphate reductase
VLITGCSDGGLGAALALSFHQHGLHVYATSRTLSKMSGLAAQGIEIIALDVLSESSIASAVAQIPSLDILINNAGAAYSMPIADLNLSEAKGLFELNVWSYLAVTQAFLPLLLKSKGMVVNQTSVGSCMTVPFQATYNASKAAMAAFSDSLRLELQLFGITVIDLKTGGVQSNIIENRPPISLPETSIYAPARVPLEKFFAGHEFKKIAMPTDKWAESVVGDLLKTSPPPLIWRGAQAWLVRLARFLPFGWLDGSVKKVVGLDTVAELISGK